MSMESIAEYVRVLREWHGLTTKEVSFRSGVAQSHISKIENKKVQSPSARSLAAITRAIKGNWNDIEKLLLDDNATEEDGRNLARRCYQGIEESKEESLDQLEEITAILEIILKFRHDDNKIARLSAFCQGLTERKR